VGLDASACLTILQALFLYFYYLVLLLSTSLLVALNVSPSDVLITVHLSVTAVDVVDP
jgi:hypothetical protein